MDYSAMAAVVNASNSTGDGDITLLLFYVSLALGVSFLCSILEAVVLSIPHTQIAMWEKDGRSEGSVWSSLKSDDAVKPLTAILTLNTIAHTMGAAGVGSEVAKIWGSEVLTGASIVLTLLVLFLSEIIPKTLGTAYWRQLARPTGWILKNLTFLLSFLIVPIQMLKSVLPKGDYTLVTRDDVAALADLGEEEGIIEKDEETVIHNLLKLREMHVGEIMTPRVVMTAFETTQTIKSVLDEHKIIRVSRIPVFDETVDDISGIVIRSELLMAASRDEWDVTMADLRKDVMFLDAKSSVDHALEMILSQRQQFAVVRDEFGGTAGLVTMEDVLETLLGEEIVDELDEVDDMRELARVQADSQEQE